MEKYGKSKDESRTVKLDKYSGWTDRCPKVLWRRGHKSGEHRE